MVRTSVEAYTIGGISTKGISCFSTPKPSGCTVELTSILKGLKNVTNVPVGYEVLLFLQNVTVKCLNPAGNSAEANGVPFSATVELVQVDTNQDLVISKNGRAISDMAFHDPDLAQALIDAGVRICRPNWNPVAVHVDAMQVFGTLFSKPDSAISCNVDNPRATGCVIEDALGKQCFAPPNAIASTTFEYDCNTICQGVPNASSATDCPQPPHELP
jgi:hypothetical protein